MYCRSGPRGWIGSAEGLVSPHQAFFYALTELVANLVIALIKGKVQGKGITA